jgi:hypothetical protein
MKKQYYLLSTMLLLATFINAQTTKNSKAFAVDTKVEKYLEKNVFNTNLAVYITPTDLLVKKVFHAGINYKLVPNVFLEAGLGTASSSFNQTSSLLAVFGNNASRLEDIRDENANASTPTSVYSFEQGKTPIFVHTALFKSKLTNTLASTVYYGFVADYYRFNYSYLVDRTSTLKNNMSRISPGFAFGRRSTLFGIRRLQLDANLTTTVDMFINSKNNLVNDQYNGGSKTSYSGAINLKLLGLI